MLVGCRRPPLLVARRSACSCAQPVTVSALVCLGHTVGCDPSWLTRPKELVFAPRVRAEQLKQAHEATRILPVTPSKHLSPRFQVSGGTVSGYLL